MLSDVAVAAERIKPYVRHTPLMRVEVDGRPVVLKLEQLQLTGSFKVRGALNALLGAPARPARVVTASGGNHGLAVATAAALLDVPVTVYTPESVPAAKARRIEATGAKLIRHGVTYAEAAEAAMAVPDAFYVPAYDHPLVVAGQGTCAAEAVADEPDIDTLVVAVGGGGLGAGTVLGSGGRHVVAVEPVGCQSFHDAMAAGRPVDSPVGSVAQSALGATRVGEVPFAILRAATSVLVTDEQILAARDRMWEEFRLAVEPGGAVPFAGWLAGLVPGELPCLIVCGANADWRPED
jgi:threonine dehydratase